VFTELREKVGTSEPAAGQEENYESTTTADISRPDTAFEEPYEEIHMSRR